MTNDTTPPIRTQRRRTTTPLRLGRKVITKSALGEIPLDEIFRALARHRSGDWGEVADPEENDCALTEGRRILSVYRTAAGKEYWVLTEADRSSTTVLLPEDY